MMGWMSSKYTAAAVVLTSLSFYSIYLKLLSAPFQNPSDFRKRGEGKVVACLGDSITHGRLGYDWVSALRGEMSGVSFINAGINGEQAFNVNKRLDQVVALTPDVAIVLVGTNDVMGTFDESDGQGYVVNNALPELPSPEFFRQNLRALLSRLQKTVPSCAVCTLPPIGEVVDSAVNTLVAQFNEDIRTIALETDTEVLPLNSRLWDLIRESSKTNRDREQNSNSNDYVPGMCREKLMPMLMGAIKHHFFGYSYESYANLRGLISTYDRIHLTEKGGKVMKGLVGDFLTRSL